MCGIVGALSWTAPTDVSMINKMARAMVHRGPDAIGVVEQEPVVFGHTRLAVIDLDEASNQPMSDDKARLMIVFNGEIYNFRELRHELEAKDEPFRTNGDTEVILRAYRKWGVDCLSRLNGMFAFALWDAPEQRLFLARDRAGKKPLYFQYLPGGGVIFASELKALRLHDVVSTELNGDAVSHFLSLNYTLTDACILKSVEKLPAAHAMVVERDRPARIMEYWCLADYFKDKASYRSENDAAEALGALIDDAVTQRLVSDVPLGAFLSGGLDSSTVVESMTRARAEFPNETFSIGFEEDTYSELSHARAMAGRLPVHHHDRIVRPDAPDDLRLIVHSFDEPFADTSMFPFFHLCRFARERVTVSLSGDGADEFFAGYPTYRADVLRLRTGWVPGFMIQALGWLVDRLLPVRFDKVSLEYKIRQFVRGHPLGFRRAHYFWRTIFADDEKSRLLHPDRFKEGSGADAYTHFDRHFDAVADCHPIDQALYVDAKTWLVDDILVKVDRASMAHSLEVRAPFLDHRLMEFAARLPVDLKLRGQQQKYLLKASRRGYLPNNIIDRPKRGFNAPVSHWLNDSLADLAYEATTSSAMASWFDIHTVRRLWNEHRRKRRDNGLRLFGLTCFGLWMDQRP